jgi:metal-dependent amidase/aminoacylase/carboxypeptidase family protein
VQYTGKAAHAGAFPELGVNAADALTVAQVAIGLLRQHLRPTDRVHGIITQGGQAPNIVPAHTAAKYQVRAQTLDHLHDVLAKVTRCFEAGALATGAEMKIVGTNRPYAQLKSDGDLATLYQRNAEALGRRFVDTPVLASTDMGNVSLVMPAIQSLIGIDSLPAVNHQPEFTAACITPTADQAIHDGALAMAWTAIDLACDETIRARLLTAEGYRSQRAGMGAQQQKPDTAEQ